jgi:cell migration-inducing and hyaluronan-binding protein
MRDVRKCRLIACIPPRSVASEFVQGHTMHQMSCIATRLANVISGALVGIVLAFIASTVWAQPYAPVYCNEQQRQPFPAHPSADNPRDLLVTGTCQVPVGSTNYFRNVNIVYGGALVFNEPRSVPNSQTHFWAASIIVEASGSLFAYAMEGGRETQPFGYYGGTLTVHLYGSDESKWDPQRDEFVVQNQGALCRSDSGMPCGVPAGIWARNGSTLENLSGLPDNVKDYFYQYGPLRGDARCDDNTIWSNGKCGTANGKVGYFGNKVLAVSYRGNLGLYGYKGATYDHRDSNFPLNDSLDPTSSGSSWIRLQDGKSLEEGAQELWLERAPMTWGVGDEIVTTTTDYIPGHSEVLKITKIDGAHITFEALDTDDNRSKKVRWWHNGVRYGGPVDQVGKRWTNGSGQPGRLSERLWRSVSGDLRTNGAETRAAVALLTRSIRIVSAGNGAGRSFDDEGSSYSYGGHLVVRQGSNTAMIKGVEFERMGQGGRLAHYPVHFHMARLNYWSYVKDSTINESMTRWLVIHSTQNVTAARNVGYKSIGHGYYLEDGTETDNKFYSNIGIFARAAVDNRQNPRKVPGILADNQDPKSFKAPDVANQGFPYRSDVENPSVFWIANGWNDFIGNMAAGAGACGSAYWLVPAANSDHGETGDPHNPVPMRWSGYAGLQKIGNPKSWDFAGTTPLKSFYKNYATSTMFSFQTTGDAPDCNGIVAADTPDNSGSPRLRAVASIAPKPARHKVHDPEKNIDYTMPDNLNDHYYPHALGGSRYATKCSGDQAHGYDCNSVKARCDNGHLENCAVTVLDHYTSSFHWAEGNVSAIWLRPQWYLLTNSVISDVQNGGLTFITGGDYTHASIISGYWALARDTIFVGNTNPNPDNGANKKYGYTGNAGPFNAISGLKCDQKTDIPAYCLNANEGISMPAGGFFANQRLSNIYDGPSYQESNAYLDITVADCPRWKNSQEQGCMYGTPQPLLRLKRKPGNVEQQSCYNPDVSYLPNAAIAWKQPNGFYYPPAFHSMNLFFDNVDLRHYVIAPLFQDGKYLTNEDSVKKQYCTDVGGIFNNWTSIDRQTELTDDDGSLTGLSNNALPKATPRQTVSVNEDTFFNAPTETAECASALGANAKPANACTPDAGLPPVTAKTSPYEYVSTVVFHNKDKSLADDKWNSECSNESCYGVPLYRQYLTTAEKKHWDDNCSLEADKKSDKCRWPFIRMAGANIQQRQTMTMNNGVYYLDTTVSELQQQNEDFTHTGKGGRLVNVFRKNQPYNVFFLYTTKTTVQTYQIYVGENFMKDNTGKYGARGVGRMNVNSAPLVFTPDQSVKGITFDDSLVKSKGILTVKVNFGEVTELDPTPEELCQPRSFCKPSADKKQCVMALSENDPILIANRNLKGDVEAACKNWAVKDLDCPRSGCLGFSFTLPDDFDAKDQYKRPDPSQFPQLATKFVSGASKVPPPDDKSGGQCYYSLDDKPVTGPCISAP